MQHFFSALGFLTIVPAGRNTRFVASATIPWFPVVGLCLGAALALFDAVPGLFWPSYAVAVLDVAFLAVATGALHLDGLGDTADGLFAHQGRERALEIMKDSRVGSMGLVAVVLVLAVKWAGLAAVTHHRALCLVLVPALARGAMVCAMAWLPYGREAGTGRSFFETPLTLRSFAPLAACAVPALFLGPRLFVLAAAFATVTVGMCVFYRARMGVVTGDMLGALCEVAEAVLFFALAAGGGA